MKPGFFITGTDTGVGKTAVSLALLSLFSTQGYSVVGMKPVAAGCHWLEGELKNDDALLLQKYSSIQVDYKIINPYAFESPVSPHLANSGQPVQLDCITQSLAKLQAIADIVIVEGAGGWLAPLSNQLDIADLALALELPVILVVAIRLGCINQARLSVQAIQASGVQCAGWIAICIDPEMRRLTENIETITDKLDIPLLGVLPYTTKMDYSAWANLLNLGKLYC